MSRTFRRKNYEDTQGNSSDRCGRKTAGYYTQDDWGKVYREDDTSWWYVYNYTYREPTERERDEEFWRIHGDTNCSWYWNNPSPWVRQYCQKQQRQKARQELSKFYKDTEYEPIIEERRNMSWWYWL